MITKSYIAKNIHSDVVDSTAQYFLVIRPTIPMYLLEAEKWDLKLSMNLFMHISPACWFCFLETPLSEASIIKLFSKRSRPIKFTVLGRIISVHVRMESVVEVISFDQRQQS